MSVITLTTPRAAFATLGEIAFGVISPQGHRPSANCAPDRPQRVATAPQILHDIDRMHPEPVGERPYGNSFGVIENDDIGVGTSSRNRPFLHKDIPDSDGGNRSRATSPS